MTYDTNNIFAKILRGEAPCHKVYEDEHTLVFMDIMPQTDGHTLVIPKEAAETILELSEDALAACIKTTKRMAQAAKDAFAAEGVSIMQVNGKAAGQTVPHVHFHIFPGAIIEILKRPHAAALERPEKLDNHAKRIIAALNEKP